MYSLVSLSKPELAVLIIALWFTGVVTGSQTLLTQSSAVAQTDQGYPQIQNFSVNVNQSESTTIFVPVDNLGSPINWTGLHISFLSSVNGIKITTDPLLFEDGFIQAYSDNYSLRIGISVDKNVSLGSYTLPFTLTARSTAGPPSILTTVNFNVIIIVFKSPPARFPILYFYLAVIFIIAVTMIGIVLIWGRNWNISEVKK